MPPYGPPTEEEIWKITRRTIGIIKSNLKDDVCLFGSAGTALWANIGRVPNVRRATHLFISPFLIEKAGIQNTGHRYCCLERILGVL
jgi:hypothetical protein